MTTGIPRKSEDVQHEARKLGYKLAKELGLRTREGTGGHLIFEKENPDKRLGQSRLLVIPKNICTEKTLRNILKSMAYFEANGLNKNGQPKARVKESPAAEEARNLKKVQSRFIQDIRGWKKKMRQHFRHSAVFAHPGPQPSEVAAAPACPKGLKP